MADSRRSVQPQRLAPLVLTLEAVENTLVLFVKYSALCHPESNLQALGRECRTCPVICERQVIDYIYSSSAHPDAAWIQ